MSRSGLVGAAMATMVAVWPSATVNENSSMSVALEITPEVGEALCNSELGSSVRGPALFRPMTIKSSCVLFAPEYSPLLHCVIAL